jgi:sulfur carrier protein ThiS
MKVYIKCFATLAGNEKCDFGSATPFNLNTGQNVRDLLKRVGLAREAVKIAFVNNRIAPLNTVLNDGDRVAVAPAVGGM